MRKFTVYRLISTTSSSIKELIGLEYVLQIKNNMMFAYPANDIRIKFGEHWIFRTSDIVSYDTLNDVLEVHTANSSYEFEVMRKVQLDDTGMAHEIMPAYDLGKLMDASILDILNHANTGDRFEYHFGGEFFAGIITECDGTFSAYVFNEHDHKSALKNPECPSHKVRNVAQVILALISTLKRCNNLDDVDTAMSGYACVPVLR